MIKRWIIRGVFILPVLLCLGGWSLSYGYLGWIRHGAIRLAPDRPGMWAIHTFNAQIGMGTLLFHRVSVAGPIQPGKLPEARWQYGVKAQRSGYGSGPVFWGLRPHLERTHIAGDYGVDELVLGVPLWLPTLLLSLISVIAWRKTLPKPDPETAFPVEVTPPPSHHVPVD